MGYFLFRWNVKSATKNVLVLDLYIDYVNGNRGSSMLSDGYTFLVLFYKYIISKLKGLYGMWYLISTLMS